MRLTSLEIKGFKSFGDKVTIHFDKGVTSIVGPNGSGKSNVVDAMRWVLGEQKTRLLRSEKMENIIFNGTKNRKQANLAEVSLTFENTKNVLPTEFATVTVTRKYYRSGESEYLLNGVTCRLKDITDLFLDTGIGPDSYSIIELKMVDDIINDRSNTIRMLLEEAAGISKYKLRKKQTFSKLEETEADLSRVNDILFEIEKNLKTLESQAKKTERYYKIKEEYKELSTQVALFTISSLNESFEKLQKQEEQQKDEALSLDAAIDKSEATTQQLKLENVDQEKHLAASQKFLNERVSIIRQKESDRKVRDERLKYLQDKESTLETQLRNDKNIVDGLFENINSLDIDQNQDSSLLAEMEKQLQQLRTESEGLKNQLAEEQAEHTNKTKRLQSLQEDIHKNEKLLAIQQTQREALEKEQIRINAEIDSKRTEQEALDTQLEQVSGVKEGVEGQFEDLVEEETSSAALIAEAQERMEGSNNTLQDIVRRLDAKQNEFNLTKSLVDNLEGFPESIKYLKKKSGLLSKAPLLSDVITCSQEMKAALESYLEPYMNYFIVESTGMASEAVKLLHSMKQGKANFFVTESIPKKNASQKPVDNCVPALELVEYDSSVSALVEYLLGHVFIFQGSDEELEKLTLPESAVLLSASGGYQRGSFTVSGGSIGLFDGKRIGRAKNLEILEKEIKQLNADRNDAELLLKRYQQELMDAKSRNQQAIQKKNALQSELNKSTAQYSSLKARADQSTALLQSLEKRLAELSTQLEQINGGQEGDAGSVMDQITELRIEKEQLQRNILQEQQQLATLSQQASQISQAFNNHNITFVQQQNKLATIQRELSFKRTQLDTLQKNIVNNSGELERIKAQLLELVQVSETDEEMIALYEEKDSLEKAVSEQETTFYKLRGTIAESEEQQRELRKRKEQTQALLESIKEKVTDIRIQLNSLKERLSVEFSIEIESLMDKEAPADLNEKESRDRLEKIRLQIANYGPINPMAVEAYNEINERHTFIVTQKEDLLKAKESLLATIAEIDTTAKEKYLSAYTEVRANFINVFRSLFSEEDKCDMVLMDMENPLESDINIIAQPKGKRPLSINQLSGGEKTLTATALLFGIYLLKPAPFCIFDEVDAPLDDTNIDKFNNIIKTFSKESQFIIITHNKRTMSFTDVIYGITMVEMGVTQVVPVDMRQVAA